MIRTEWQADAEIFALVMPVVYTAESDKANAIRCAESDLAEARRVYVMRRAQIGTANKATGWLAKAEKSSAFTMFNKARAALNRAEKALKIAMEG